MGPRTWKDLLRRDWRAKFISLIIGIAIWAVIKPLVQEKQRSPGKSPGGGSALVTPPSPPPLLTRQN